MQDISQGVIVLYEGVLQDILFTKCHRSCPHLHQTSAEPFVECSTANCGPGELDTTVTARRVHRRCVQIPFDVLRRPHRANLPRRRYHHTEAPANSSHPTRSFDDPSNPPQRYVRSGGSPSLIMRCARTSGNLVNATRPSRTDIQSTPSYTMLPVTHKPG